MCRLWEWLKRLMKKSNGDVRVVGMVAGNHVIEDLGRDVAYRTMVIIPEDQALMSKDLWRSISQGFLYQVPSAPYPSSVGTALDPEKVRLEKYTVELEAHVVRLRNENEALKRQLEGSTHVHAEKLEEILKAIQSGAIVAASQYQHQVTPTLARPSHETVDGSAPTFMPSEIRPKDLDARITIQGEESTSEVVSEAADRLRQLRKKSSTAD